MAKKKLYRSSSNQMVAGVLAGFADYFNQDPTMWRLFFVFFLVITGVMPGLLMYLFAWIIMPLKEVDATEVEYTVYE